MYENPSYDRSMLQAVIYHEFKETFFRKFPDYVTNDKRKKNFASRHTVSKWYKHFVVYQGILF